MLGRWVRQCEHTDWRELSLPRLAEGSEHLVHLDESAGEVVKLTREGVYGDYYEIVGGRVTVCVEGDRAHRYPGLGPSFAACGLIVA